jgi:hypothetical protein
MSTRTPSVSAVIRLVNAPPALRIDVVGPDPPPVLLLPALHRAQSSAGPVLLELRVVLSAPIHCSTVASLRVTGTRVRHDMAGVAPARSTPQSHSRSIVLRRWMLAVGWTCEIRVCIRVMRHGRLGTIDGADRLATLTLDACHLQTLASGCSTSPYSQVGWIQLITRTSPNETCRVRRGEDLFRYATMEQPRRRTGRPNLIHYAVGDGTEPHAPRAPPAAGPTGTMGRARATHELHGAVRSGTAGYG